MQTESISHPTGARGPHGLPYIGVAGELKRDVLGTLGKWNREYGDLFEFRVMGRKTVFVNRPDLVQHVLQSHSKNYLKGHDYEALVPVLGQGLLTSEKDFWKRQRKLAQPAFHQARIIEFSQTMASTTGKMLDRWETQKGSFNVSKEMMGLTLRIAALTLFGTDVEEQVKVVDRAFSRLTELTYQRIFIPFKWIVKLPLPNNLEFSRATDELNKVVYEIISKRRGLTSQEIQNRSDLLSILMAAQDEETGIGMTEEQLRDEIMTLLLAGHETTANALSWALYLLATHPNILKKARNHVKEVLGDRPPEHSDLQNLDYIRMIFEETLRLYPPAWWISRRAIESDQLGPFTVDENTTVGIGPYFLHRNPKLWDSPEVFDPLRFEDSKVKAREKFAYIPFGAGPRSCIGKPFAMAEGILVLAMILQRYSFEWDSRIPVIPQALITLRQREGVWLKLNS